MNGAVAPLAPSPSEASIASVAALLRASDALLARAVAMLGELARAGGVDRTSGLPSELALRLQARRTHWDARELCGAAEVLASMPTTARAFEDGELSWSQVRAIAREARPVRPAERARLDAVVAARADALRDAEPEQLVEEVADVAARLRPDLALAREDRAIERSFLRLQPRLTGGGSLYGEADAERFATIAGALDAAADRPDADEEDGRGRRHMDALVAICENSLAGGGTARPRPRVLATLDITAPSATARILTSAATRPARLTSVATEQLLCDADIVPVVFDGARPVAVGRAQPTVPQAARTAVIARDGGCRFPGCSAPVAWSDVHHIRGRARGGGHDPENLVLLCRRCHRRVHRHRWRIEQRADDLIGFMHRGRTFTSGPRARPPARE